METDEQPSGLPGPVPLAREEDAPPADPFYIGWRAEAPEPIAGFLKIVVAVLLACALVSGIVLAAGQRDAGSSKFEFGKKKEFSGWFRKSPYPHLLVPRPGEGSGFSSYYLVSPYKFGLPPVLSEELDGKHVTFHGSLVYRGNQTLVEVADTSPNEFTVNDSPDLLPPSAGGRASLGEYTFQGEIVDSKCYLGVMNPGNLTTHRACAVRCISGGVPPVFLVRQENGTPLYLLLVGEDGGAVNDKVLDLVAEPVEITGVVERDHDLLILKADPSTYQRVRTR